MKKIFPTFWQALLINYIFPIIIGIVIVVVLRIKYIPYQIQMFNDYFGHLLTIPFLFFFLWKSQIVIKWADFKISNNTHIILTIILTVIILIIFFGLAFSFEKIFNRNYPQLSTPSKYFLSVIHALIITPVIEELLYRRIFLHQFLKQYSTLVALLLSTFLFVIPHIPVIIYPELFFFYFISGSFLGFLYYKFRSISLCMLSHFIMNLITYFPIDSFFNGFILR